MTDPLFDIRTPRHDLPLLFAGQSQKESFVNEVTARVDALLHMAIEAEAASPPGSPADGQCWLVASGPTGDWTGRAGQIAAREAGNWLFLQPRDGMQVLNKATGQGIRFHGSWKIAAKPVTPTGGSTIDTEARAAIAALLVALVTAGIVPAT